MALTHTIENLDNVQEEFHSHYAESDGKLILQIDDISTHPDVVGLSNALGRTKAKLVARDSELSSALTSLTNAEKLVENLPEDFDMEVWTAAKDKKPDAAISSLQEKMKALRAQHEGESNVLKAENAKLVDAGKRMVIERGLDDLITASGIAVPAFQRAVLGLWDDPCQPPGREWGSIVVLLHRHAVHPPEAGTDRAGGA